jgi:hypothetical protein
VGFTRTVSRSLGFTFILGLLLPGCSSRAEWGHPHRHLVLAVIVSCVPISRVERGDLRCKERSTESLGTQKNRRELAFSDTYVVRLECSER